MATKRPCHHRSRTGLLFPSTVAMVSLFAVLPGPGFAGQDPKPPDRPAVESRLNSAVFRAGLKKRGLTDLLTLHLKDFPPAGKVESLLMHRDIKLAEYSDVARSQSQRQEAVAQANHILEEVIREFPKDARRFQWRFDLAHDLLYKEAEPYVTSLLYRGGGVRDRRNLTPLSTRALAALTALDQDLAREFERVDGLSIPQFNRLEADGTIQRLDQLEPRANYLMFWALFYDSLSRERDDPLRNGRLQRVLDGITSHSTLVQTPHAESHVQVQAMLLEGMAYRRLKKYQEARQQFNAAIQVAEQLDDPAEQQRIQWAITLAWLERIRNEADAGEFDDALVQLGRFRERSKRERQDDFGLQLITTILERSVYRLHASAARRSHHPAEAQRFQKKAWQVMDRLARQEPDRRDDIYATIKEMIDPHAPPEQLDPFEQCAVLAGLLFDAGESDDADALLNRAIQVGQRFLSHEKREAPSLLPEVLYNLAVAEYRLGDTAEAAGRFLEIAEDHSTFSHALQAATLAAQLGDQLHRNPARPLNPQDTALYRHALQTLVTRYRGSTEARYWRFYYAQLLDELEEYDLAAAQYAQVDRKHEHFLDSRFGRVRCLALVLRNLAERQPPDLVELQRRASDFFAAQRDFVSQAHKEQSRASNLQASVSVQHLLARSRVMTAEVQVLARIHRPTQALDTLADFENTFPNEPSLSGRIWRVRLLAYEQLGRIDQAMQAIPAFVQADPVHAAATLGPLYVTLAGDADRLRDAGQSAAARPKAELALLTARQVYDSLTESDADRTRPDLIPVTIQLAEANLRTERYQRAAELLKPFVETDQGSAQAPVAQDQRILIDYAEAMYQLGQFSVALPRFNRLAMTLAATDPIRWKSLLRDLQCRTALGHPPEGIIQVIQQQKRLYPALGGNKLASQFDKLQRSNQRRLDAGS